jgi:hypothetical protein
VEKLKANYETALIEIFKVISWLDDKRWKQEKIRPDTFVEKILEADELQPAQKVLVHWLIYITDRGKLADMLWENSTPKIKELVVRYFNESVSRKEQVAELWEKYEKENKVRAFPADLESIKRTLILLLDYSKNIIKFMTRGLSKWANDHPKEFCPRVAFSLYILSYRDVQSLAQKDELREQNQGQLNKKIEEAKSILNTDAKFEEEFKEWYCGSKRWHKRTWAALRDYKKSRLLLEILIKGIQAQADQDVWRKDFTKQLELPGDIWNTRFFEKCIKPIAENMEVPLKGKKTPSVVRDLWRKIESKCPESYPEQLDITFDFVPRMCDKKFCAVCPLGPDGAKLICIPSEDRYCPVALISCGYIVKCGRNRGQCAIKEGVGKRTCRGGLWSI